VRARSAKFDSAVRYGGTVSYRIDVQRVSLSTGVATTIVADVKLVGPASVHVDTSASSRRSLRCTLADPDGSLAPIAATDPLAPFGNELVVRTGFSWPDGSFERVDVGTLRIVDAEADGDGAVRVSCLDRSVVIAENRFTVPYVIPAGTNVVAAIQSLLLSRYPGLTISSTASVRTVPLTVYQEGSHSGDPWRNARDLAAADGLEVFFDAAGVAVIRPVPNPAVDPLVWSYKPGADSIYIGSTSGLTADGAANIAVVTGEGTGVGAPIRSVAQITDPASPLYPNAFGPRPVFLASPLITTQAQCDAAAVGLLQRSAGGAERLRFTAAPHPAHEGGDVVQVVNAGLGLDRNVVLASFETPIVLSSVVDYATLGRRSA
jgi:hypothetical protein